MEDIFVPKSSVADALVSPLHTVTYVTSDGAAVDRILKEGYGLTGTEWLRPDAKEFAALNDYLGFDAEHTWSAAAFTKAVRAQTCSYGSSIWTRKHRLCARRTTGSMWAAQR